MAMMPHYEVGPAVGRAFHGHRYKKPSTRESASRSPRTSTRQHRSVAPQAIIFSIGTGSIVTMIICADIASAEMIHSTAILIFHFRLPRCFTSSCSMVSIIGIQDDGSHRHLLIGTGEDRRKLNQWLILTLRMTFPSRSLPPNRAENTMPIPLPLADPLGDHLGRVSLFAA